MHIVNVSPPERYSNPTIQLKSSGQSSVLPSSQKGATGLRVSNLLKRNEFQCKIENEVLTIMIDIVFLTYVHRSGSTYFASLLNNCKELGVSLSSGSLGKIIDAKQLPIRTEADAAVIFEELFEDSKFREWQISKEYLMDVFNKLPFPIYFPDLLELVLVTYFQRVKPSAKLFIFKRLLTLRPVVPFWELGNTLDCPGLFS